MVHDFNPFIWQISGQFGVRWYGFAYLAGFICAFLMIHRMAITHRSLMPVRLVTDFITYGALGTLIGGRLGYVIFYSPDLIVKFKSELPYWGVLAVNEGGMASHGGMIGLAVACWLFSYKHRLNLLHLFDLVCIVGPIGVFFGRIANFVNGELVGRPCSPGFPLGVKFPSDIFLWPSQNPEQLRTLSDVVGKLGVSRDQWLSWVEQYRSNPTSHESVNDMMYKIVDAIQHGQTEVRDALGTYLTLRHPSQLYGAMGEGLFLFLMLMMIWVKPRKPGVIASWFIVLYAIVRICDEQFRMPDAHIGFMWLDLTRGQWLSIGMLIIGFFLMAIWSRRFAAPIGGWSRTSR